MNEYLLKQYVCKNPFHYLDIQDKANHICCPSWCSTDITTDNKNFGWNDTRVKEIQKSILDGSYKFCDKNICPSLNKLINSKKIPYNFVKKEKFIEHHSIKSIDDIDNINFDCHHVVFGFDRSCQLKCPTCRSNLITNSKINSKQYNNQINILNTIEHKLAPTLKSILITGSGDPFYSNLYRNYLINFDKSKYPMLEFIKIITNGQMLNESLWESLNSKDYIKSIEISIDAGTKDTYEKITRLNGKWDKLIDNLKFLSKVKSVLHFELSFVVNELNYKEMEIFYKKMSEIFLGRKFEIVFRQHVYWPEGVYSKSEVESLSVFENSHPNFKYFLNEFNRINKLPFVNHNFNHLIEKTLI
jgi:MoaA/NifB/PqqE/SkfB family radical SAM enzyme